LSYDASHGDATNIKAWRGISDVGFTGNGYINESNQSAKSRSASSRHPAGVNTGFCDGSVRFIKETIDHNGLNNANVSNSSTYSQLLNIDDNKVITGEF